MGRDCAPLLELRAGLRPCCSGCPSDRELIRLMSFQIEDDLLHPSPANEKRKHKLKRLVQSPNSFFMDVKCPGCFNSECSTLFFVYVSS